MTTVASAPREIEAQALVSLAIGVNGPELPHFTGSAIDQAAAVYDLVACIHSARSILGPELLPYLAAYLLAGER